MLARFGGAQVFSRRILVRARLRIRTNHVTRPVSAVQGYGLTPLTLRRRMRTAERPENPGATAKPSKCSPRRWAGGAVDALSGVWRSLNSRPRWANAAVISQQAPTH